MADTLIPDPGDPVSYDRYAYTRNNPVRYTDPSGHVTQTPYDPCPGGYPVLGMSSWTQASRFVVSTILALTVDNLTGGRTGVYGDGAWGVIPQGEFINSGAWLIPPAFGLQQALMT
jgi:hypothetical protein